MTMLSIDVDETHRVSAIWTMPAQATAAFVFAHGAGAGMNHAFMAAMTDALVAHGIAVLRYQFPYMEQGAKRPDRPALAHTRRCGRPRRSRIGARAEHFPCSPAASPSAGA